jgi:formylglycine-generating enzyme required for sulfatase activity
MEWARDFYGSDYYARAPAADPQGPAAGDLRVARGRSWYFYGVYLRRSASRLGFAPDTRLNYLGFRLAFRAGD